MFSKHLVKTTCEIMFMYALNLVKSNSVFPNFIVNLSNSFLF